VFINVFVCGYCVCLSSSSSWLVYCVCENLSYLNLYRGIWVFCFVSANHLLEGWILCAGLVFVSYVFERSATIVAATHCNTLQHSNTLQHTVTHYNTLQHSATHYNTHCNTLVFASVNKYYWATVCVWAVLKWKPRT